ncbi:MAG: hypothetical protein IE926_08660 [Micrococcales bacterium]|nr:hypothetical protein [Micrococcales bacterium]
MGTSAAVTTLTLLHALVVVGVVAVLVGLAVVVPALTRSREDRIRRHLSVPAYYGLTPAH